MSGPAIGVDLGGTKIAAGLVDVDGTLRTVETTPTPSDPDRIPDAVAELVDRLRADETVVGVGIGAAGFVDADRATVRFAPNIDWRDEPLADQVAAQVDLPVVVENDANAAAWGEFRFGAGSDAQDLLFITLGTGVGGGIVHAGALLRGAHGMGAEVGHLRVVPDGLECGCGQRGCIEQYASGSALVREARRHAASGAPEAEALAALARRDVGIDGRGITSLAHDGDALARRLLADVGRWTGEAIASLVAILDPAVIAVGGGVAEAGDLVMEPMSVAFSSHLTARAHRPVPELRRASLGTDAGIVGAADLSREAGNG